MDVHVGTNQKSRKSIKAVLELPPLKTTSVKKYSTKLNRNISPLIIVI